MLGGTLGLELVGLEDSTAPYKTAKRMDLVDVGQLTSGFAMSVLFDVSESLDDAPGVVIRDRR